jgi:hypothetical protein
VEVLPSPCVCKSFAVSLATAGLPTGSATGASAVGAGVRVVARTVRRRSRAGGFVDAELSDRRFLFAMVQVPL